MQVVRIKGGGRTHTFVLPTSLRQRLVIRFRGWRPADLTFTPLDWWTKRKVAKKA